ncbi:hypothetical protein PENTCL1PPCAC_24405, partial [Pristionchus entomophagus]
TLLTVPFAWAINCFTSATINGVHTEWQTPCGDAMKFCYTFDEQSSSYPVKSCGYSCTKVGEFDVPNMYGTITCCDIDYCNPASNTSFIMAIIIATLAALQ